MPDLDDITEILILVCFPFVIWAIITVIDPSESPSLFVIAFALAWLVSLVIRFALWLKLPYYYLSYGYLKLIIARQINKRTFD